VVAVLQASRKLAVTEVDLGRSETRLEAAEMWVAWINNALETSIVVINADVRATDSL